MPNFAETNVVIMKKLLTICFAIAAILCSCCDDEPQILDASNFSKSKVGGNLNRGNNRRGTRGFYDAAPVDSFVVECPDECRLP